VFGDIVKKLQKVGYQGDNIRQVALWLLERLTNKSQTELLLDEVRLSDEQEKLLNQWIVELVEDKKPLQYILGSVPFCGLDILVKAPILIPRPETEEWVTDLINLLQHFQIYPTSKKDTHVLRQAQDERPFLSARGEPVESIRAYVQPKSILDLCTGSGCVALALAHALSNSEVVGADISEQAVSLACKNKERLKIKNVLFVKSDLFEKFEGHKFDLIVANPPYVTEDEWLSLESHVKDWEDKIALVASGDDLNCIKKIVKEAPNYFKKDSLSLLVLEIGFLQADTVCTFLRSCGYTDVEVKKDFAGHDRIVMGRYVAEKEK